ncbi:hypothetical protein A2U01_0097940, partial [Trifolium medium]|nr:hypothetical protein [Trifolium medium]
MSLSLAVARNFQKFHRFLSLKLGIFGSLGLSVVFARCSEGLSDVPSLSFAGSRP